MFISVYNYKLYTTWKKDKQNVILNEQKIKLNLKKDFLNNETFLIIHFFLRFINMLK